MNGKRSEHKDIELSNRKWRVSKFDPRTGSYICLKIVPMLMGAGASKDSAPESLAMKAGMLISQMSKSEFFEIQTDALSVVSEIHDIDGKETAMPLIHQSGVISAKDVDTMLLLALTGHALSFNIQDFFASDALKDLGKSLKDFTPSAASK